ncbi:MAG: DNA repair protein RadC [Nitrospirota bacterium]
MDKGIKTWPEDERPRERLIKNGAELLSDAQLLAIILRTGKERKSAVDIAMDILNRFEGLRRLADTTILELCSVEGIGPSKAAQIKAALEIGKRIMSQKLSSKITILNSKDIYHHYSPFFKNLKKERFKTILLDSKNNILRDIIISEGTLSYSVVHPREAFNPAIRDSASSVIFLHNHPSGDPSPSPEDVEVTKRLVSAGNIIGIKVLDHIIIGDGRYMSFADSGLI